MELTEVTRGELEAGGFSDYRPGTEDSSGREVDHQQRLLLLQARMIRIGTVACW